VKGKYTELIVNYCNTHSILIPEGFYRGTASHIAIIRLDKPQPKLVAKTFFKMVDVKYYLNTCEVESDEVDSIAKVINFKDNRTFEAGRDRKLNEL